MRWLITCFLLFLFQETISWKIVSNEGPEPRYVTKLVDSTDGLLLFGGKNNNNDGFNNLWKWQNGRWKSLGIGATKRWDHSYAFLTTKKQLLLFGGRTFETKDGKQERIDLKDSWIYENGEWQQLGIEGPSARSSHALVGTGSHVLLFGGRNKDDVFSDTWIFDRSWKKLAVIGPEKRFGHSLSYDEASNTVYLFGGHNGEDLLNDIWAFKDGHWTEIKTSSGPSARMAHSMAFDHQGNGILFGGWSGATSNELWKWSDGKWSQIKFENGPSGRLSHAMGYDHDQNQFILFGGSTGFGEGFLGRTWRLQGSL